MALADTYAGLLQGRFFLAVFDGGDAAFHGAHAVEVFIQLVLIVLGQFPAEVFGAAFAGGWAFGNLFALGEYGTYILQILFFALGIAIMIAFIRSGMRIEPFTTRE